MQLARGGRIEDVAALLEGGEGVGVEHLRPHVAIVGRSIAAAGEYVPEMGGTVAHHDLRRHADAGERRLLKGGDVEAVAHRLRMEVEIDQRRGDVFHRGEALVEGLRPLDLLDQRVRDRLAGLCMQAEALHHLLGQEPMLVELRRQLHPIGEHVGARDHRIGHV